MASKKRKAENKKEQSDTDSLMDLYSDLLNPEKLKKEEMRMKRELEAASNTEIDFSILNKEIDLGENDDTVTEDDLNNPELLAELQQVESGEESKSGDAEKIKLLQKELVDEQEKFEIWKQEECADEAAESLTIIEKLNKEISDLQVKLINEKKQKEKEITKIQPIQTTPQEADSEPPVPMEISNTPDIQTLATIEKQLLTKMQAYKTLILNSNKEVINVRPLLANFKQLQAILDTLRKGSLVDISTIPDADKVTLTLLPPKTPVTENQSVTTQPIQRVQKPAQQQQPIAQPKSKVQKPAQQQKPAAQPLVNNQQKISYGTPAVHMTKEQKDELYESLQKTLKAQIESLHEKALVRDIL